MDAAIRFTDVEKSYGALQVLRGVSFAVGRGEKISLIGPSGSGKTTILRVLMTLEKIDGGRVEVDGEALPADEGKLSRLRSRIGIVFQHFNLFPHMSALKNVTLGPILTQGLAPAEAEERGRRLLGLVGLGDKAESMPHQLSGGQKQRVAIARALALKPKIMLFDEITSALDPELVEEVLNVVRRLGQETDMTMLLVTHAMSFARDFADRVLFFDHGRVLEEGPPDQIFSDPREERTRSFLKKIVAAGQAL